ncbi:MAG: SIR2 family protein [Polynucleobacter sp.]|nr:SIR2 family protein [Polynucleobacter sp.]
MTPALHKIWCDEDEHYRYEHFADFNEWLDSEEGQAARVEYGVDVLPQPSKALFSGDRSGYDEAFQAFRKERRHEALGESWFQEQFADDHWFQHNEIHFIQLVDLMYAGAVVPFVGAGISASAGFSSWKDHLRRQGKTAHIASDRIEALLASGAYETVLEEIEAVRGREVFIQEIRDEFSRNLTIPDVVWHISELFTDTVITTNYDRLLEQSFETGEAGRVQVINGLNALEQPDPKKITVIKLHGDIREPKRCILSKNQYDEAYGNGSLNMHKPIPKLLAYHYKNSSLLFLGCSLSNDRTVQVFKTIKEGMGEEEETKQHFSIEQAPESLEEIAQRNAELAKLGITPIWFEKERYELVESILSLAKNELRHRGVAPQPLPAEEPPIKLDMDLSHFLGDFIDLMPLLHWLHRAVPQTATRQYLSAMQRVFHGQSFATRQTDNNLMHALDNLLRALANSAEFDGYTHGKLSAAFASIQQYLKSIGERSHLGDDFKWNIHELLTIPALQLEPLVANKVDGGFDYHAIRLMSALLQHGKNQRISQKSFCELPGAVNHEFGDYISLALSANLGVTVPDRLDQMYTGDIRSLCEVAWNNFDKPVDLKFFERVKLMVAQILK